jgi:hypothetical protein
MQFQTQVSTDLELAMAENKKISSTRFAAYDNYGGHSIIVTHPKCVKNHVSFIDFSFAALFVSKNSSVQR